MQNQNYEIQIQDDLIECEHKDLIHNAICKICYMLLQRPILVCNNCGYFACKKCIRNWQRNTQNQSCPQKCSPNSNFQEKQIPQLEKVLGWITIRCPNSQNEVEEQRCNKKMGYNEVQEHIPNCQFKLVKCRFVGCSQQICIKDLIQHEIICQFNRIKCQFCRKYFKYDELEKHQAECDYRVINCQNYGCPYNMQYYKKQTHLDLCKFRKVNCELCHQNMPFQQMEEHLNSYCIFRKIICIQCNNQIQKKDELEHKLNCPMRTVYCENCQQSLKFIDLDKHTEIDCIKSLRQRLEKAYAKKNSCMQQIQEISSFLNKNHK